MKHQVARLAGMIVVEADPAINLQYNPEKAIEATLRMLAQRHNTPATTHQWGKDNKKRVINYKPHCSSTNRQNIHINAKGNVSSGQTTQKTRKPTGAVLITCRAQ